ncbi:redoxin domain-containing protein [Planosporangium thailandense]|uniref:Redoxin domain-containing protein n=1 Tax=Planosporangium thailandense TaxID=765197 RepID=A0ABX0XWT7_9ACTN|nr:redoxin domain-containing protein [Planosporangium thailandense]NJC70514.1 redoxin domain-containing protein [Planosporangium thailandense]
MTDVGWPERGRHAPDFCLRSGPDRWLTLSQLRGRPVVLAFYPADWNPVCSDQMALYQAVLPEFTHFGAALLGISVDGVWCHRAWAEDRGITFPLLADFEPKGEVARAYHAYRLPEGVAERALFVLDRDGHITWAQVSPPDVNPGADGILTALEALTYERQVVS